METKDVTAEDISEIMKSLIGWLKAAIAEGPRYMDKEDLKETADAIKDLAEAGKECQEALYYKSVVKAMESGDDAPAYLESMRSGRMGYRPIYPMGYSDGGSQGGGSGYSPASYIHPVDPYPPVDVTPDTRTYGQQFAEYRQAKKNYSMTHSPNDKNAMDMKSDDYIRQITSTIHEMWDDADQAKRAQIKNDLMKLVQGMNV